MSSGSGGYFWVASRFFEAGLLPHAGHELNCGYVGRWWRFIGHIGHEQSPSNDYRRHAILKNGTTASATVAKRWSLLAKA